MWTACTVSMMRRVDDSRTSVSLRGLQRHVLHLVISLYPDTVFDELLTPKMDQLVCSDSF